jgi:hypothetical protein
MTGSLVAEQPAGCGQALEPGVLGCARRPPQLTPHTVEVEVHSD